MTLSQKAVEYFMAEFKNLGVLDTKNMGMVSTLISQFGGDLFGSKPETKSTKSQRRAKAQKKYRREQRKKLKSKKNNRRRG